MASMKVMRFLRGAEGKLTITVIFPVDYKHAGHIVDDVSASTFS